MTKNNNFRHRWKALVDFISYDHGIKMDIELLKLNGCKIYLCQKDHKREEK